MAKPRRARPRRQRELPTPRKLWPSATTATVNTTVVAVVIVVIVVAADAATAAAAAAAGTAVNGEGGHTAVAGGDNLRENVGDTGAFRYRCLSVQGTFAPEAASQPLLSLEDAPLLVSGARGSLEAESMSNNRVI